MIWLLLSLSEEKKKDPFRVKVKENQAMKVEEAELIIEIQIRRKLI